MWSGRMRIVSKGGRQLFINLEDGATGELFAACHAEDEKVSPSIFTLTGHRTGAG